MLGAPKNLRISLHTMAFIIAMMVFLSLKWEIVDMPYYWDALGGKVLPAIHLYENGFQMFKPALSFGHPPLMPYSLALTWWLFGYSLIVSHLYILLLAGLGIYFTWRIGLTLNDPDVAVGAVILLIFNQLFFAQAGILNDSIPLLAFGTGTVLYYLERKQFRFIITVTIFLSLKETSLILFACLFLHFLLTRWPTSSRGERCRVVCFEFVLPVIPLVCWFIYLHAETGGMLRTDLMYNSGQWPYLFV